MNMNNDDSLVIFNYYYEPQKKTNIDNLYHIEF